MTAVSLTPMFRAILNALCDGYMLVDKGGNGRIWSMRARADMSQHPKIPMVSWHGVDSLKRGGWIRAYDVDGEADYRVTRLGYAVVNREVDPAVLPEGW